MQMQYTKNLNPGRFELGTILSQPIRSFILVPYNDESHGALYIPRKVSA